ncbi:MAG: hypothetical protein M1819_006568 [Sarea resinae]|nr:MAG: hypothetical protein M1819_006568 [Sarea resinae]
MENLFINALVKAGSCKSHTAFNLLSDARPAIPSLHHRDRRKEEFAPGQSARTVHTSAQRQIQAVSTEVSRDEYKGLLDFYVDLPEKIISPEQEIERPGHPSDDQKSTPEASVLRRRHQNDPGLDITAEIPRPRPLVQRVPSGPSGPKSIDTYWSDALDQALSGDEKEQKWKFLAHGQAHRPMKLAEPADQGTVAELKELLQDKKMAHEIIMDCYKGLPYPGVQYLPSGTIRLLLHRLSKVEHRSEASMLRFLSIVDDMRDAKVPLTSGEWSSAIGFAGRCFVRVSAAEVQSALSLWREMEMEAGVKSTHVTFNILFDIAVKAGKYVLAEMILKEMRERALEINRFSRVSLIYYYGVRGDGDGIRQAYKELVDADEVVDTAVLNCLISSLIKAGEPTAAEQVYERMKRLHSKKVGAKLPARNWRGSRELGKLLARATRAAAARANKLAPPHQHYQRLKDEVPIAPDIRTYRALVAYHAVESGELDRVSELLNEMQFFQVPLHGCMFLLLLQGFARHGGVRYTSWTRNRLESVWGSFLQALDDDIPNVYLGKWVAIWAVRAYGKCADRERTMAIWEDMHARWTQPSESDLNAVKGSLVNVLRNLDDEVVPH